MANVLQLSALDAFARGDIDLITDTIRIVYLSAAYTYNAAHDTLSDVPAGARVATSPALTGKTLVLDGVEYVFDAADTVTTNITGAPVVAYYLYQDTGSDATSQLIQFVDSAPFTGFTPPVAQVTQEYSGSGILRFSRV